MTLLAAGYALGDHKTNNQAEYYGLLFGLHICQLLGLRRVHVFGDSQLVIYQMEGSFKVRSKNVMDLHCLCKELADKFESIKYEAVPRELNTDADMMSKMLPSKDRLDRPLPAPDLPRQQPKDQVDRALSAPNAPRQQPKDLLDRLFPDSDLSRRIPAPRDAMLFPALQALTRPPARRAQDPLPPPQPPLRDTPFESFFNLEQYLQDSFALLGEDAQAVEKSLQTIKNALTTIHNKRQADNPPTFATENPLRQ